MYSKTYLQLTLKNTLIINMGTWSRPIELNLHRILSIVHTNSQIWDKSHERQYVHKPINPGSPLSPIRVTPYKSCTVASILCSQNSRNVISCTYYNCRFLLRMLFFILRHYPTEQRIFSKTAVLIFFNDARKYSCGPINNTTWSPNSWYQPQCLTIRDKNRIENMQPTLTGMDASSAPFYRLE